MTDPSDVAQLEVPQYREIQTARLRLRTTRPSDAAGLFPIVSRADVMQWTSLAPLTTLHEAERWITDRALGKDVYNFIIDANEASYVGIIGTFHLPRIGYLIHPDMAGRGFATEALQALIPALFEVILPASQGGIDYLEGMTDKENGTSRRVLEKCGFVLCETRFRDFHQPILGLRDTCVYRVARPGHSLGELGLIPSPDQDEETRIEPPIA